MIYLTNLNLNKNELQNARIQNLAADPASPVSGQIWFNSALGQFKYYDGTQTLVIPEDALAGTTAPTTLTVGNIGQFYLDTQNVKLYLCVAKSTTYTWKEVLFKDDIPPFESTASNIKMDGTAAVGTLSTIPRADHVHPSDTSRVAVKPNGTDLLIVDNKINTKYIPESIIGQLEYKGTFNASTGSSITGLEKGWYYIAATAGSKNPDASAAASAYAVGDWAVYNGTSWDKVDNTDAVTMVNSQIGSVETYKGAWTASSKYYKGDIVLQADTLWLCVTTHTAGTTWSETNWKSFGKAYSAGTGISINGTTINHANSITAQPTQAVYPIKIDAQGHITGYGSAVTVVKKFASTITGNGSTTSFTVTHNLGTAAVVVEIYDSSSKETVIADVVHTDSNTVTISFAVAVASGKTYEVTVIG